MEVSLGEPQLCVLGMPDPNEKPGKVYAVFAYIPQGNMVRTSNNKYHIIQFCTSENEAACRVYDLRPFFPPTITLAHVKLHE